MTQRTFRQIFLVTCVNGLSLSGISYKKSFSMKIFSRFNVIYMYSDTFIMKKDKTSQQHLFPSTNDEKLS